MKDITGTARRVGDDINTDYIISSRRKRDTLDGKILSQFFMEDLDPSFAGRVEKGDILVAGKNFGCGSAMEIAAVVIKEAGIAAVIAESFSRSFYRNGINNGILLITGDTAGVNEGDRITIIAEGETLSAINLTNGCMIVPPSSLSPIMADILQCGGLVGYIREKGAFRVERL